MRSHRGRFFTYVELSYVMVALIIATTITSAIAQDRQPSSRSSRSQSSSSSSLPQCDRDRDGVRATNPACGGRDCNDSDPEVGPGREESSLVACQDGKDNDCNGAADCSDKSCTGKPAFVQGVFSLELTGLCCQNEFGGQAIDPSKDARNCGGCGLSCGSSQRCVAGRCVGDCTPSTTACFKEPAPFEVPIKRDRGGRLPSQLQVLLDGLQGNPDCPIPPGKEPKFDLKYWSEPLRDHKGNLTGDSVRGLCVTASF